MPRVYLEKHAEEPSWVTEPSIRADRMKTRRAVPRAGDLMRSLMMHIWVDADACPKVIKDLLYRAADRWGIALTLVANQPLRIPRRPIFRCSRCQPGLTSQITPSPSTSKRATWS
jgi:hypothetical protein